MSPKHQNVTVQLSFGQKKNILDSTICIVILVAVMSAETVIAIKTNIYRIPVKKPQFEQSSSELQHSALARLLTRDPTNPNGRFEMFFLFKSEMYNLAPPGEASLVPAHHLIFCQAAE